MMMAKKEYPPHIQELLNKIKQAKLIDAEQKALAESQPAKPYEMRTTYLINQVEQSITIELAAKSDLSAWNETHGFLREFYKDDDLTFINAEIYERRKPKFETTDLFFIWRKTK